MRIDFLFLVILLMGGALSARAHGPHHGVESKMAQSANALLATLSSELREKAEFPFDDLVRTDWHFVPKERVGLSLKEMTLEQRRAAHALLRVPLSSKGYLKATAIMGLEQVLRQIEGNRQSRDQEKYWFAIFGKPGSSDAWGWRVEGHHLSLNFTSVDGLIVSTPMFLGANPAEIRTGPRAGFRALAAEEDLGRKLISALQGDSRQQAMISDSAPADVITVPGNEIDLGAPAGIAAEQMATPQQQMLRSLIRAFVSTLHPDLDWSEMKTIEQDFATIHFAWAGSILAGEPHYFRIHGKKFVIEYDNTQNDANHVHAVWHSLNNDFALDLLRSHHELAHP